jgi:hypothetical protein
LSTFPLIRRLVFVVLFTCIAQVPVAHATLLSLQPDTTFAGTGDSISLDLIVSGLGDFGPDSLGAFDVSVEYDAAVLSFASYALGSLLGDLGLFEAIDASAGDSGVSVNVAEVSLLSAVSLNALQPGEFVLASLNFDVLNRSMGGATQFSIASSPILAEAGGSRLPVTDTVSAIVEGRASVPLPGMPVLFLIAMFGWSTASST